MAMTATRLSEFQAAVDFGTLGDAETSTLFEMPAAGDCSISLAGTFASATVVVEGTNVSGGTYSTLYQANNALGSLTAAGTMLLWGLPRYWRVRTSGGAGAAVTAIATVSLRPARGVSSLSLPLAVTDGGTGGTTAGTAQFVYLDRSAGDSGARVEGYTGVLGTPARAGLRATGTSTNIDLVLSPQGTGALMGQFPDSAATGGNARGTNAVDWQTVRSAAAQVASGATSVVGGGTGNTASGAAATVGGGTNNTASAAGATVGGGASNTASGGNSVVAGGAGNATSGVNSWSPGGREATDRGSTGRGVWASARFATNGDAQCGEFVLRRISTDATAVRLTADNAAQSTTNTVNLPNSGTYMLRLLVTAQQTGGAAGTAGDCAGWDVTALIKRGANAAATVLVGNTGGASAIAPTYSDTAPAAWRIQFAADTTNGGLAVAATGEVNKTIRWVARVLSVETTA